MAGENRRMVGKLAVVAAGMFAFGYALIPIYKARLRGAGHQHPGGGRAAGAGRFQREANTQVDTSRTITVEFDANARGPWHFKPAQASIRVHPGELATVVYEFQNVQDRRMAAQAIPSYAPRNAAAHFNKLECFCFNQYTLEPGEKKQWPVAFVIDPRLPKDVTTITLSYTFFEVGGKTPPAPQAVAPLGAGGADEFPAHREDGAVVVRRGSEKEVASRRTWARPIPSTSSRWRWSPSDCSWEG
jgi:cytochrome c oxidase assembly protein subunit 11